MSNEAGDSASRLSEALDEILSGGSGVGADDDRTPVEDAPTEPFEVPPVEDAPTEPFELPPIVSATAEPFELPPIVSATEDEPWLDEPASTGYPVLPPHPVTESAAPGAEPVLAPQAPAPSVGTTPTPVNPISPPGRAGPRPAVAGSVASQLRAPGRRARVRRVTRVLRHIDPWSTFKVALVFSSVAYVVTLTSGVLLWRVADSTGTLANVERWFTQFGWETFEFQGGEIFHNAWIIGLFGVVATTGGAVLLVTLFNLVSDIVGGVRMTVLEEEVVERTVSSTRRYVVRPGATSTATSAAASDWSVDDDGADESTARPPGAAAVDDGAASSADWSVD